MAEQGYQIPNINLVQDTPTAPNHEPVPVYTSPRIPRIPENGEAAPEVDRHAEGLQVDTNGPYPQPTTDEKWAHYAGAGAGHEKQLQHDDAGLIPCEQTGQRRRDGRICGLKRRTFIIIAAIVGIIVICAAIGGGVGGYYANRTPTPTTPASPTDTTDGPVTSGTTGMAAKPCKAVTSELPSGPQATPRNIDNPYRTFGATFDITCRRSYTLGHGDRDGVPMKDVGRYIKYNFTDCMNECANNANCRGVVYSADLTDMVADGNPGVNCLLKNGTFNPDFKADFWTASALKM